MLPTWQCRLFIQFFLSSFPDLVNFFRKLEKASIKTQLIKARIEFLRNCLQEKVLPRSLKWMEKLNDELPFCDVRKKQLILLIAKLKEECNCSFFKLRIARRNLFGQVHDFETRKRINSSIDDIVKYHKNRKRTALSEQLNQLISKSPWSKLANTGNIINLSSVKLTNNQLQLLGYGLNFSLPHQKRHLLDFAATMNENCNSIKNSFISMNMDSIYRNLCNNFNDFLPRRFRNALQELKGLSNLKISAADKGGKIVLMDMLQYNLKIKSILSDKQVYKEIDHNPLKNMQTKFNKELTKIKNDNKKHMDDTDLEFLMKFKQTLPSLPYMYGLPKIHKNGNPLRPIVSNCNSPSYKLSKMLAKQLSPLLGKSSEAHLRNNKELIESLKNITPGNNKFISFDAVALFTNVPLKPTLDFLKRKCLPLLTDLPMSTKCFLELIDLCTKDMFFQFNNKFYQQVYGFAMGNPLSPVLACLFLEHVETEILPKYTGIKPVYWKRYVDDIISLVTADFDLNDFMSFINNIYPSLKFTYEWENNGKIPFLDVNIFNMGHELKFSVYRKFADYSPYMHFFSYTALNIKTGLALSLFLRALRVCSNEYLTHEINFIKTSLKNLAYPDRILKIALFKAKRIHFQSIKNERNKCKQMIVVPYAPCLETFKPHLRKFDANLVFKHSNKLKSQLINNKPPPSSQSGVYKIDCNSCHKSYIGETGRDLSIRVDEHRNDERRSVKLDSGIVDHNIETGHHFDFANARIIYPCNNKDKMHLVESSLIWYFTRQDRAVNLNYGFAPKNMLLSYYIKNLLPRDLNLQLNV